MPLIVVLGRHEYGKVMEPNLMDAGRDAVYDLDSGIHNTGGERDEAEVQAAAESTRYGVSGDKGSDNISGRFATESAKAKGSQAHAGKTGGTIGHQAHK